MRKLTFLLPGGVLAGAILFSFAFALHAPAAASPEAAWTIPVGGALAGPACGSSSPSGTCSGGSATETITWSYSGCTDGTVSLALNGGTVISGQNCSSSYTFGGLAPNTSYQYSLTYTHYTGNDTEASSFTTPNCAPAVSLSASPQAITQGAGSVLTWSSSGNVSSCSGTNFSPSGTSGSIEVYPSSNTIYSVQCSGPGGAASASVLVSVTPSAACFTVQ